MVRRAINYACCAETTCWEAFSTAVMHQKDLIRGESCLWRAEEGGASPEKDGTKEIHIQESLKDPLYILVKSLGKSGAYVGI